MGASERPKAGSGGLPAPKSGRRAGPTIFNPAILAIWLQWEQGPIMVQPDVPPAPDWAQLPMPRMPIFIMPIFMGGMPEVTLGMAYTASTRSVCTAGRLSKTDSPKINEISVAAKNPNLSEVAPMPSC